MALLALFCRCGPNLPSEVARSYNDLPQIIDYNFHVKPIISDRCYACHGPDKEARKGGLRLDIEADAFALLESGTKAFVHGDIDKSEVIDRILSHDPEMQMPPPESKLSLDPKEIATIIKWVEQGAEWKPHWAFIPPNSDAVPTDFPKDWSPNNEIDHFIYQRLADENIKPSPKAEKEVLIRRVTMDLTGLPPTIAEIDDFLSDQAEDAYERLVDRLLSTDAHAERLAMEWMDVSRYADSHGMHADGSRYMWPWRDWVIKAFKENLSYDDFVTWQLAGDQLPNATQEQILATAFHRNHPTTAEGGVIDEEWRVEYVANRTNTTATAFMGLTMECARCHDHKYDPISQKEYYQMSAFFNNMKELGMNANDGNLGPTLMMTDKQEEKKIVAIRQMIANRESQLKETSKTLNISNQSIPDLSSITGLVLYHPFERTEMKRDGNFYLDGNPKTISIKEPLFSDGKFGNSIRLTGNYDELSLSEVVTYEAYDDFSAGVWINTTKRKVGHLQTIIGNTGPKNGYWRGWDFQLTPENQITLRLISALPENYIQVTTTDSVRLNTWSHVMFTYDGSMKASGIKLFINGIEKSANIDFDHLYKSIHPIRIDDHTKTTRPLRMGKSYRVHTGEVGIYKGLLDELRLYNKELTPLEVMLVSQTEQNPDIALVQLHHLQKHPDIISKKAFIQQSVKGLIELVDDIPEVMVLRDMEKPRPTYVLNRGQYDSQGEEVLAAAPESILKFPDDFPKNRLGLAKWLFMNDNPLTARVAVNRYWQMVFGSGIVRTSNDFGSQGALPSHPKLLDWLAVDFVQSEWNLRRLLKQMVMSATYQQSSKFRKDHDLQDPENVLLARSPSYRWPAEVIRDNALAASGLLVKDIGGKSVKPYQPDSLWIELGSFSTALLYFHQDHGDDLYRRSMYTFIRRTSPPPYMTTFDVAPRSVCVVKRESTNTPLQALNLMNDPQFVEAAKVLAERVIKEKPNKPEDQIIQAFRLVTSRIPNQEEMNILMEIYNREELRFNGQQSATKNLLSVGEYEVDSSLPVNKLAAMTMVTNTMLNLDGSFTKR